jgi:hypothetical protein
MAEFGENITEETLNEDYSEITETSDEVSETSEVSENPEASEEEEVTYEDYLALKREHLALKERLKKAESKIVEIKKQKKETSKTIDKSIDTEMRLFFIENPEAKEYKDKILELKTNSKYKDLDLEDLLDLAKAKTPPVSKTKTEYDFKSLNKPKNLESMSEEEAIEKLSPSDFLKWARAN